MKILSKIITPFFLLVVTFFLSPVSAEAATLSLSPASGTFNKGCNFSLDIILDTQSAQTDGTDAILFYDTSRFTANTISTGTIYPDYPGSNIDASAGKITVSGLASISSAFSGKGTLASVNFTVAAGAPTGASQIKFDFDSNDKTKTTDSNVVERGTVADILSSVTNGSYTVGSGSCASGSTGGTTGSTGGTGRSGSTGGTGGTATASAQPKTIDQLVGQKPGTPELTFTIAILGSTLTILGILGLIIL